MKYKLNDENESDFSVNDLSRSSNFRPVSNPQEEGGTLSSRSSNFGSSAVQKLLDGGGRVISGQSDTRNEELSLIYIARRNTVDGKIDYAALDLSAAELQERLENLQSESNHQFGADDVNDTSQALPGDTTMGTEDFAHNGRFVNLRRGGNSHEGSFQRRMLSPSSLPAIDESAMLPEESMQASTPKQLPKIRKTRASNEYRDARSPQDSPSVPRTPHPSPSKTDDKGTKSSSGSPLKLFGTYDTFTNQTLLRRLRSFEGNFDGKGEGEGISTSGQDMTRPELNDAFVAQSSPEKASQRSETHGRKSRKVNSFGDGDLDSFQFSEEISYDSHRSMGNDDKENVSLPVLDPSKQTKFKFALEPSPSLEEQRLTERRTKITSTTSTMKHVVSVRKTARPGTSSSDHRSDLPLSPEFDDLETPRKRNGNSEGKRLPKSPLKYPTPKRRRTLREAELVFTTTIEDNQQNSPRDAHQQMQSVMGRKRKDARHDDDQQAANPKVLAMRQILRPRTPTPNQRSSQQREHAPFQEIELSSADRARLLQEQKIAKIQAELDSTDALRLPAVLGTSQHMFDESRKGSVTTQDFLDEAKKIMAGIRGKARPRSGLTSLEESESENDRNVSTGSGSQNVQLEDSYQESTKEPFSRPPSREGGPLPRLPKTQQDPALLDHLRQYEEMSDMEDLIASSMKSIAMAKNMANSAREIDRVAEETISRKSSQQLHEGYEVESDPPNIRITENPEMQRKRKHSTSSAPTNGEEHQEFHSQGSNASSGESTSRSIPTGSSRGSDSRRVIAPHTVSHLIPEQLAGMVFDRERNIWIKRKTVSGESGTTNFFPSDEMDDDPFGDIPDLSVDETQELQRIKAVATRRKEEELSIKRLHSMKEQEVLPDGNTPNVGDMSNSKEPGSEPEDTDSSTPSKPNSDRKQTASNINESASLKSTIMSTVRSSDHTKAIKSAQRNQKLAGTEIVEAVEEEIEKEISILEDRVDPQSTRRRRNVTISFSSPLASIIEPSIYNDQNSEDYHADEASPPNNEEDFGNSSVIITKRSAKSKTSSNKLHAAIRSTSRRVSVGGHTFSTRPVSRIDEQDENSLVENSNDRHRRNTSIVVTTPAQPRRISSMVLATPRPSHEIGTLELTPMSDFTVHQADESFGLNVSYVAGGQRYVSGDISKRTLSLSIKELVEKLTEVEPYEPFWGHIKQLNLRDKKLTNLHKLNEFCEKLEELDVSNNKISQLNGASSSIRNLRITHNQLSDLTAWGHLTNLQYIDVSNNQIESLSAFKYLVHLRGLRADNNHIKSLDGISHMDGLLSLRLRGNQIESLDFKGTKLHRLSDLDVNDNHICHLYNLHELPALTNLTLEGNKLCCFATDSSEQLSALKYLKMSSNNLTSIDVSQCPNLRLLYLDRNRLGKVKGLLKTKHLDSLSLRDQQLGAVLDLSFLSEAFEVRKLFLSGNLLSTFQPRRNFLNLQYLELANCGLESLPVGFGQMFSNTRVLNLNLNALKSIRPLLGIVRLKRLHLAGNRLSRLRKVATVLVQLRTPNSVDLRGNPLTIGFYPPIAETQMVVREGPRGETIYNEPFTLGKGDAEKDDRYASRLDMETRMLRRAYEMLILGGCARLQILDGLSVNRSVLDMKDKVWDALVEAGIVSLTPPESKNEAGAGTEKDEPIEEKPKEEKAPEESILSERWPGEDSFA
jgi:Leucine-rich repeat (LRR) protein